MNFLEDVVRYLGSERELQRSGKYKIQVGIYRTYRGSVERGQEDMRWKPFKFDEALKKVLKEREEYHRKVMFTASSILGPILAIHLVPGQP